MGLFSKIAGGFTKNGSESAKYEYKKAKLESKEKAKQEKRDEKANQAQQLIDETHSVLNFTKMNFARISATIRSLDQETFALVNQIESFKGRNLSKGEKKEAEKAEEKYAENAAYLYLVRDYLTILTRLDAGLTLKDGENRLIIKMNPYFDGTMVLDHEDEEEDDSLLGGYKEMGKEFRMMFLGSRNTLGCFSLNDYVAEHYGEEIQEHKLPDIEGPLASFEACRSKPAAQTLPQIEAKPAPGITPVADGLVSCPTCHASVPAGAKFCPECGSKIETPKSAFCAQCGTSLSPGAKFCPNCGAKVG
jgi:RNA polymerase subunit RPABC4/transcription elongation factor Spt4